MTQLELPLGPPAKSAPGGYTVFVDDNFHYMDEDERYTLGVFATVEEAIAACRSIVDRCLNHEPGMTAEAMFKKYAMFGEDPFIPGVEFSAWTYAKERCAELAAG